MATSFSGKPVEDDHIAWFIDNKEVGKGRDIWVKNPGKGRHKIKMEATDKAGTGVALHVIEIK